MAEVERREEISADTVRTFLCDSNECNVDNRKCMNIGSGTESNNDLREVFQVMKKRGESTSDHADWRW
jgi:hypothetical protein